ncbi:MAG TPA: c-type cytochrome, partial [Vicinamibacteria bacterium]|nr:c-type cytochrome [Vicinamibacteria bacterium]
MTRRSRSAATLATLLVAGAAAFWLLTRPAPLPASVVPSHELDLRNGETLFHAGSCLACHRPPDDAPGDHGLPSGGRPFPTPIGVFYPQNLTPDPETGLGRWNEIDFVNAMRLGISPSGTHYFPAFPYASYRSMTMADLLDLRAYLRSLPAVRSGPRAARVPLLTLARRGVGLWKRIAFRQPAFSPAPGHPLSWTRGAYLVNAPGHCGECHTPKDVLMVADQSRFMAGGPHPGGEGKVPSLRGLLARKRYKSADDLVLALQNGETLGYEHLSSGGMAAI